ncbi:hypothetical protein [Lonepinella sp. MS14436]|uniref:hypothetical protein n=1 Tax=Lonepinella sp. MS14436 TaxID=3003619 RepID=UPI0036DC55B6
MKKLLLIILASVLLSACSDDLPKCDSSKAKELVLKKTKEVGELTDDFEIISLEEVEVNSVEGDFVGASPDVITCKVKVRRTSHGAVREGEGYFKLIKSNNGIELQIIR